MINEIDNMKIITNEWLNSKTLEELDDIHSELTDYDWLSDEIDKSREHKADRILAEIRYRKEQAERTPEKIAEEEGQRKDEEEIRKLVKAMNEKVEQQEYKDDPYYTTAMFTDYDELYNNYEDEQPKEEEPIIKEEQNQDNKKKQQDDSREEEEESTLQSRYKPFYQCPYNLLNITKKTIIPLLAHKIIYMWKTSKYRDINRYAPINNTVLASAFNINVKTLKKYIKVLEDLKIIQTKIGREGKKFYKVNKKEAMKYFNESCF